MSRHVTSRHVTLNLFWYTKTGPPSVLRTYHGGISWDEVTSLAKRIMSRCQLHDRFTLTCFKRRGKQNCGLGWPKSKMPSTKFSKLIPPRNLAVDMITPLRDENIAPSAEETPIPAKVTQVLCCDHKRVTNTDANLVEGNIQISATFRWNTSI